MTALGATSDTLPVISGVPQGSILGPMLFLLCVNSLPDAVQSSQVAMFANDTKLLKAIKSSCDTQDLQQDVCNLASILHLSTISTLQFNSRKCKAQRITRKVNPVTFEYDMNGSRIDTVSAERDLGVFITEDLTWATHVSSQCAKVKKLLGFIRRNTMFITSPVVRRTVYLV